MKIKIQPKNEINRKEENEKKMITQKGIKIIDEKYKRTMENYDCIGS